MHGQPHIRFIYIVFTLQTKYELFVSFQVCSRRISVLQQPVSALLPVHVRSIMTSQLKLKSKAECIIIIVIYLTVNGQSSGGSGYYACT